MKIEENDLATLMGATYSEAHLMLRVTGDLSRAIVAGKGVKPDGLIPILALSPVRKQTQTDASTVFAN